MKKEIEGPETLNFIDYDNIHNERALQELDKFYRVSFRHEDMNFSSQAWNRLFKIQEPVISEYVLEFLSIISFKDHVVELDVNDTYSGKEKVTLVDLFYLHIMDGGELVDVPCHAKIVNEILDDSDEEADADKARRAQEENEGSPRRCLNMILTNRLRVIG
ncbi:hypothetical protein Tco_1110778 [Tanacetum coccineum]|uniref:Uncharacterized protein n=1 Tax=Tanacetum coccineum TaxID=301880 RepID=A0ABQ5IL89_9ASTR